MNIEEEENIFLNEKVQFRTFTNQIRDMDQAISVLKKNNLDIDWDQSKFIRRAIANEIHKLTNYRWVSCESEIAFLKKLNNNNLQVNQVKNARKSAKKH